MRWRHYLILSVLSLAASLGFSLFQDVPGYMDAEYYYAGSRQLYLGEGLQEPFLWNYLDDPTGLPHPSHTYWMPLPSLIGAAGMLLTQRADFFSARLLFFILYSLVPSLTAHLSYRLSRSQTGAMLAGFLAIFSGFYVQYTGLTESFTLVMLAGTIILLLQFKENRLILGAALSGICAGAIHLSRTDGVLWLALVLVSVILRLIQKKEYHRAAYLKSALTLLAVMMGYLAVMGFWYARNLQVFQSLFIPGATRALWLNEYDQLFTYPASLLDIQHWAASGLKAQLIERVSAFARNLTTAFAVEGEIFLTPLILVGLWEHRKKTAVAYGAAMWLTVLVVMTMVFPFAGSRGGFLHSTAALQPLFWALAPGGLMKVIAWATQKKLWKDPNAEKNFSLVMITIAAIMTAGLFYLRVVGPDPRLPIWQQSNIAYSDAGTTLRQSGAEDSDIIVVNNPPGFYLATGFRSIVIPYGDEKTLLMVMEKYQARYLLLEKNCVAGLRSLYEHPRNIGRLEWIGKRNDIQYFKLSGD